MQLIYLISRFEFWQFATGNWSTTTLNWHLCCLFLSGCCISYVMYLSYIVGKTIVLVVLLVSVVWLTTSFWKIGHMFTLCHLSQYWDCQTLSKFEWPMTNDLWKDHFQNWIAAFAIWKAESPSSGDKIDMYILLFSENAFLVAVGVVEYFHCVKVVGVRGDRGLPRQLRRRLRAEKETDCPLQEDRQAWSQRQGLVPLSRQYGPPNLDDWAGEQRAQCEGVLQELWEIGGGASV